MGRNILGSNDKCLLIVATLIGFPLEGHASGPSGSRGSLFGLFEPPSRLIPHPQSV